MTWLNNLDEKDSNRETHGSMVGISYFYKQNIQDYNKNDNTMLETQPLALLTKQKQLKSISNTRVFGSAWIYSKRKEKCWKIDLSNTKKHLG